MKHSQLLHQLDHIFDNPQNITTKQLEELLSETLNFFDSIRNRISSGDLQDREKAMKEAAEMQEKLNQMTDKIYKKTGLTKEKAQKILSDPKNFKPEDWEKMKAIEKELDQFQKTL